MHISEIPQKKFAKQSLTNIYGLNKITATKIIGIVFLHPTANDFDLRNLGKEHLIDTLSTLRINFKLRLITLSRILLLQTINSYRGIRISQSLPSRGRTHSNGKTLKTLKKLGKFFPFKIIIRRTETKVLKKKIVKKVIKKTPKITAKIKAKNKARAKIKKKANKK